MVSVAVEGEWAEGLGSHSTGQRTAQELGHEPVAPPGTSYGQNRRVGVEDIASSSSSSPMP